MGASTPAPQWEEVGGIGVPVGAWYLCLVSRTLAF